MRILKNRTASIRITEANPDHHLYDNNGTWYVHYTQYVQRVIQERVRRSLKTKCLETARSRRDQILNSLFQIEETTK
jgi:hypothetical protein